MIFQSTPKIIIFQIIKKIKKILFLKTHKLYITLTVFWKKIKWTKKKWSGSEPRVMVMKYKIIGKYV